jgi:hypothetical protein
MHSSATAWAWDSSGRPEQKPDLDAARFGQQVGTPPGDLPQLGDRGSRCVLSGIALPDMTPGRSDQFGHDQPVGVGSVR